MPEQDQEPLTIHFGEWMEHVNDPDHVRSYTQLCVAVTLRKDRLLQATTPEEVRAYVVHKFQEAFVEGLLKIVLFDSVLPKIANPPEIQRDPPTPRGETPEKVPT